MSTSSESCVSSHSQMIPLYIGMIHSLNLTYWSLRKGGEGGRHIFIAWTKPITQPQNPHSSADEGKGNFYFFFSPFISTSRKSTINDIIVLWNAYRKQFTSEGHFLLLIKIKDSGISWPLTLKPFFYQVNLNLYEDKYDN